MASPRCALLAVSLFAACAGETSPPASTPDVVVKDAGSEADLPATIACNGDPALCDRRLDQVVFATTHNAMSSAAQDWFAPNQPVGIATQLADGIRAMMWDTHWDEGELHLCHGLCALGKTPLSEALADLKSFLDQHPTEVVVLILEDRTPVPDTAEAFVDAGLEAYLAALSPSETMPTLGELVATGRRLVVTAEQGAPPPDWYHSVWSLVSDTGYSWSSPDEFTCACNRGCPASQRPLFLLNHWVSDSVGLPDDSQAETVNSYDVLFGRAVACWESAARVPNFVAVDHYSTGDLFEVVDALNARVGAVLR